MRRRGPMMRRTPIRRRRSNPWRTLFIFSLFSRRRRRPAANNQQNVNNNVNRQTVGEAEVRVKDATNEHDAE